MNRLLPRALCQARPLPQPLPPRHHPLACPPRLVLPQLAAAWLSHSAPQPPRDSAPRSRSRPPVPPPSITPEKLAGLAYVVRRTPFAQLPIYRRLKSGGSQEIILIKKVDGDRRQMVKDLIQSLSIKEGKIRINPTTQHIELKGQYFGKASAWLLEQGF